MSARSTTRCWERARCASRSCDRGSRPGSSASVVRRGTSAPPFPPPKRGRTPASRQTLCFSGAYSDAIRMSATDVACDGDVSSHCQPQHVALHGLQVTPAAGLLPSLAMLIADLWLGMSTGHALALLLSRAALVM